MKKKINISTSLDINKMLKNPDNYQAFLKGIKKGIKESKAKKSMPLNKLTGSLFVCSADMFIIYPNNPSSN